MNTFAKLRRDVGLRNLTIYAQWTGILSSLAFVLVCLIDLVGTSIALLPYRRPYGIFFYLDIVLILLRTLDILILAPGVLILESPRLCHSIGWVFPPYAAAFLCVKLFMEIESVFFPWGPSALRIKLSSAAFICGVMLFCLSSNVFQKMSQGTSNLFRLPIRVSIYCQVCASMSATCTTMMLLHWGSSAIFMYIAPILAAAAGVLYGLAWYLGHKLVHSRLLGGSGIEPMAEGLFDLEAESGPVGPGQVRL